MTFDQLGQFDAWSVQRRDDGAVLVRIASRDACGRPLPDAVFAFRDSDPQHEFWERVMRERESASASVSN
jgi:hypothetical protein